jgi:hypothetical protein
MLRGALHVHSVYSDGEFTLPELRQTLQEEGCAFAFVADHAQYFDEVKLAEYGRELERLSDSTFTFVPGLEFECEKRLHIVGYGAQFLLAADDPEEVIGALEAKHAVAVIAHPKTELFSWIESFGRLPSGIEVWNSKYDGRYAPRAETFGLLSRLQARRTDLRAFYGQDLHWRHQYRGLHVDVAAASNTAGDLLDALRKGNFSAAVHGMRLPSTGALSEEQLLMFSRAQRRSDRVRHLMRATKRVTDRIGLSIPAALKSQARRIF